MPARRNVPAAAPTPLKVKVVPAGSSRTRAAAAPQEILNDPSVQSLLKRGRHRLLTVETMQPDDDKSAGSRAAGQPRRRATIVDYAGNRTLFVESPLGGRGKLQVTESGYQPLPTREEFVAAVKIVERHPELGASVRLKRLLPYPTMPPLLDTEDPSGRPERTLTVGLRPQGRGVKHEIVGVNMVRRSVVRFDRRAPDSIVDHEELCGVPFTQMDTIQQVDGPGAVDVTVSRGNTVLWKLRVVRPAATKGPGLSTNGTGVELQNVDYRGKRVLYRAHVPILNVKYGPGGCGAFRDWQNEEGFIHATGTDVADGFRLCSAPAKTILESHSDTGNFLGVGIYVEGEDVVFVSEMEAGWYRYVSRWRLRSDGTIKPRFGFGAIENPCVCNIHNHHVYWRLDFDVDTPGDNLVREFNDPPLPANAPKKWHDHPYEVARPRDPGRKRRWRVENTLTGDAYDIVPGARDGVAASFADWPFGRGDLWFLRYHANEIDDGVPATGPPYAANLAAFLNGEPIRSQDVVVWYGAHFTHDVGHEGSEHVPHIVGPTLEPASW
jgi:hypothetical protein